MWGVIEAKCILVTAVCVSVCLYLSCLSVCSSPHSHTTAQTRMWRGNGKEHPLVVHYWADWQLVHAFRCYDNVAPNAKCQRVLVLALCLVNFSTAEHRGVWSLNFSFNDWISTPFPMFNITCCNRLRIRTRFCILHWRVLNFDMHVSDVIQQHKGTNSKRWCCYSITVVTRFI